MMNELRKPRRVPWKIVGGTFVFAIVVLVVSDFSVGFQERRWAERLRRDVPLGESFGNVQAYLNRNHVPFQVAPAGELFIGSSTIQPVYDPQMLKYSFTVPIVFGRSEPIQSVFLFRKGRLVVRQVFCHQGEELYMDNDRSPEYQ